MQDNKTARKSKNSPQVSLNVRKFLWLRNNFAYCLALSALIWFAGIAYYIQNFIGWESVLAVQPTEFAVLLLAASLPLLLLWFLLAYIERSSSLDANAELFHNYIDGLLYPDAETSKQAKALAKTLLEQTQKLQQENKSVVEQSLNLKKDLDERLGEFANILQLLDSYSAKTLTDLNDGVKNLADKCTYITDKTTNSVNNMKDCSAEIANNASMFLSRVNPLLDEISALSSSVKNNIADNKNNLAEIKSQLEQTTNLSQQHIDNMLEKTAENTLKIENSFYKTSEEFDGLCKRIDTSISSLEGRIDEQKRLIATQTQVLDHNSDLLGNKLSSYGQAISVEIDKLVKNSIELEKMTKKQISTLRAVNSETGKAIHGLGDTFDEKRHELERRCEYVVNSMQNVIIALNKETDRLISFTNLAQAKNFDLQNISETMVEKVGEISSKLALKTDTLKGKAVEVIDKFNEAHDVISKNTDKINASSNLILSNSQQGVKLLEEQSFYINNALTNLNIVQEKLDNLKDDIKKSSAEMASTLADYEKKIDKYNENKDSVLKVEPLNPDFSQDKLISTAQGINRTFIALGIKIDKIFANIDVFDLWDKYLIGETKVFTDFLSDRLTRKQTGLIRKAFDDKIEFHNLSITYLYLMDMLIKEMMVPDSESRNECINLAVNASLDKIYFILIKALNSAE